MRVKILIATFMLFVLAGLTTFAHTNSVSAHQDNNPKITICHRTDSVTNPYDSISVDVSAADGGNDHGDHYSEHQGPLASSQTYAQTLKNAHQDWGDIIPPVPGHHNGLNWTTLGQAMYNNDCNYVTQVEPTAPTFVDPTCDSDGSYTIPTKTGVVYKINGNSNPTPAGTYTATNGQTVTINAYATNSGYLLTGTVTWTHTFAIKGECTTEVSTVDVTFVDPTCDTSGSYTIPTKTGVVYKINGNIVTAGTYKVEPGDSVTVNAFPASSAYTLTGTTTWSHDFTTPEDCNTNETVANIHYGVACSDKGAVVTLTNDGTAAGDATVNGEVITVGIGATVTRTFDTTDSGLKISIVINDQTVYDQVVTCDTGSVLGASTDQPITKLPYTSGDTTLPVLAIVGVAVAAIGLASITARTVLSRR
ncbi:hypothetical protein EPN95_04000 [Patescibacteria group bacterium]|nr:MAG: hypothetical protein EPN95_04000 [Patescibacteria group bacterium]